MGTELKAPSSRLSRIENLISDYDEKVTKSEDAAEGVASYARADSYLSYGWNKILVELDKVVITKESFKAWSNDYIENLRSLENKLPDTPGFNLVSTMTPISPKHTLMVEPDSKAYRADNIDSSILVDSVSKKSGDKKKKKNNKNNKKDSKKGNKKSSSTSSSYSGGRVSSGSTGGGSRTSSNTTTNTNTNSNSGKGKAVSGPMKSSYPDGKWRSYGNSSSEYVSKPLKTSKDSNDTVDPNEYIIGGNVPKTLPVDKKSGVIILTKPDKTSGGGGGRGF